jgi:hypothetical protein
MKANRKTNIMEIGPNYIFIQKYRLAKNIYTICHMMKGKKRIAKFTQI